MRRALARGYGAADLRADVLAGAVVGIVALPLSMALAIAVGAPPQHGLYTAIFAGTVLASAISLVLLTFGSALGLSLTSAHENTGISMVGFSIAAALWLVWVQVSGPALGPDSH